MRIVRYTGSTPVMGRGPGDSSATLKTSGALLLVDAGTLRVLESYEEMAKAPTASPSFPGGGDLATMTRRQLWSAIKAEGLSDVFASEGHTYQTAGVAIMRAFLGEWRDAT